MLKGKVALITGASRGIGMAIAEKLAQNGAKIALNFKENKKAALEARDSIIRHGNECLLCQADVSNYDETGKMVNSIVESLGKIDILVNNAGIVRNMPFNNMSKEDWNDVINTNLNGVFNVCRQVSPHMTAQGYGKIVNISSVGGIKAVEGVSNYSAAKAGIMAFTKVLGKELIKHNINVNCVAPGLISTDLLIKDVSDDILEALKAQVPAGRIGEPEEVADMVLYLCMEQSRYIVGQTFIIDGGLSL